MLRESRTEEVSDHISEVASAIAEEGLRYVSDSSPGYRRKRTGTSFTYYDKDGKRITDQVVIRRIKSIGIPPAYEFVWICPSPNGHIQATGLDARGRKQYRYHPKWRELRDQNKYEHVMQFAAVLPALRARVASDMKRDGLPREKVLATIVSLLEKTLIRVGNAEYAEKNKSYGLTTIRRKHVAIGRGVLRFDFTGKSGKQWKLQVEDRRIAAIVKRCAENAAPARKPRTAIDVTYFDYHAGRRDDVGPRCVWQCCRPDHLFEHGLDARYRQCGRHFAQCG
jgi:DNA topoisomerase I